MYVSPPRPDTVDLVTSGRLKYVWRRHVNEKDSASGQKHEGNHFQCQETVFATIESIRLWNSLDSTLCSEPSFSLFKRHLIHFYSHGNHVSY